MTITPDWRSFLESETSGVLTIPASRTPRGYEQVTDLSSAVSLSPPTGARIALLQAEDQNVRWRDDGTEPTAAISFIEEAVGGKLNITYYG